MRAGVVCIASGKGGVGKSVIASNIACHRARAGERVCLVDLDSQAHASLHLGLALADDDRSIYDVLMNSVSVEEICQSIDKNLWLVPSHLNLAASDMELANEVGRELILRDKLALEASRFDYLIIDCPPSLGLLTINALSAVGEVFLPLQPHFLALHGLSKLLRTIDVVSQRLNDRLQLTGVVLCMYDSGTRLAGEVTSDVEQFFAGQAETGKAWAQAKTFATRIRRNIRLAEAPSFGQSIFQYAPRSAGSEDYRALAEEVHCQVLQPAVTKAGGHR